MVVFVAAIFTVSVHFVVGQEGIVAKVVVGRAVHIRDRIAVGIIRLADLSKVGQRSSRRNGIIDGQNDVDRSGGSGRDRSGEGGLVLPGGSRSGPGRSVEGRVEIQPGGDGIGHDDVGRRQVALVDDTDSEGDGITCAHTAALPHRERFGQCQIEGLYGYAFGVVIVLVFSVFTIPVYIVVSEESIVVRVVVGRRIDVGDRIAVAIAGIADLCEVAQFGPGSDRSGGA